MESGGKNQTYSRAVYPAPGAEMQTQQQERLRQAEEKMFGAVCSGYNRRRRSRPPPPPTPQLFSDNTKFPRSEWIPPRLSFTAVQLIGLILASVPLKAWCICPPAAPEGRKHNTSPADAAMLANFKEILGECVWLSGVCPPSQRRLHMSQGAQLCLCCWIYLS